MDAEQNIYTIHEKWNTNVVVPVWNENKGKWSHLVLHKNQSILGKIIIIIISLLI